MFRCLLAIGFVSMLVASLAACNSLGSTPTSHVHADFASEIVPYFTERVKVVQFTDMSTGPVMEWEWDLDGDGRVDSTKQHPRKQYSKNGLYTVTLTVRGPLPEDVDTITKDDCIEIVGCPT